jgi:hypothetical protein
MEEPGFVACTVPHRSRSSYRAAAHVADQDRDGLPFTYVQGGQRDGRTVVGGWTGD